MILKKGKVIPVLASLISSLWPWEQFYEPLIYETAMLAKMFEASTWEIWVSSHEHVIGMWFEQIYNTINQWSHVAYIIMIMNSCNHLVYTD